MNSSFHLPEIVAAWMSFGWTKRESVAEIIGWHMLCGNARGRGSRSKRRINRLQIEFEKAQDAIYEEVEL